LSQENGKDRFLGTVRELSQTFALAVPHDDALRIRDDVAFFQAVQAVLAKRAPGDARPVEELDQAVRQIISRAIAPEGVLDIFAAWDLDEEDEVDLVGSVWPEGLTRVLQIRIAEDRRQINLAGFQVQLRFHCLGFVADKARKAAPRVVSLATLRSIGPRSRAVIPFGG
jgi:hypothetical protein